MKVLQKNKQWYFNYEIVDTIDAWIILLWHEVKQIKVWHSNLSESILQFHDWELRIINMDIPLYVHTTHTIAGSYNPKQRRKILITKQQRIKLYERTRKTWLAIIPLKLYEAKNRKIKLIIWLGKLKKKVEKRSIIKERDIKRQMDRDIKDY